ncbi:hypothetical protein [Actinomadura parmotrematis]|uniref:Cytochrome c n=1 Tax=Actinomadura parmotrematis TaxID=2864039 RepID=A0ABS7FPD1_9ACTN|nr:hypothetical protein [Actinomadura parmotrematis]MBW8482227.1 hypothetical protein [Actinomadura parmotrematis]
MSLLYETPAVAAEVLQGTVEGDTTEGIASDDAAAPAWAGKPISELTAAEAIDVLAYIEAHRVGDETIAKVLANVLVNRHAA